MTDEEWTEVVEIWNEIKALRAFRKFVLPPEAPGAWAGAAIEERLAVLNRRLDEMYEEIKPTMD